MSLHSKLREQFPFLTPPFVPDNDKPHDLLARTRDPLAPKIRVAFGARGLSGVENPKSPPDQPMAGGIRLPGINPVELPAERNPYEGYTPERKPPPPVNIRVGANTAGLDPVDRSIAVLNTQRQAVEDYPSSKVTESGEVLPPKMHSGAKDRLKSAGKGALIGLERGGPVGAIIGAITGGVSPITIDKIQAERALMRKEAQVGRQVDIQTGKAQLENLRSQTALRNAELMPDPNDPTKMIPRPPQVAPRYVERGDGVYEISTQHPEGRKLGNIPAEARSKRGETRYFEREDGVYGAYEDGEGNLKTFKVEGIPGKPRGGEDGEGLTPYQNSQRQAKAADLIGRIDKARRVATELQQKIDADLAAKQRGEERGEDADEWRAQWESQRDAALSDATAAASELNAGYGDLYEAAEGEADTRGKKWPYYKPRPQTSQRAAGTGDTRKGTISKEQKERWLRDNPGKTVEDLKRLYPNAMIAN